MTEYRLERQRDEEHYWFSNAVTNGKQIFTQGGKIYDISKAPTIRQSERDLSFKTLTHISSRAVPRFHPNIYDLHHITKQILNSDHVNCPLHLHIHHIDINNLMNKMV